MKLRKVYRFRMRPTKAQEVDLYRMAGARRFIYNWSLDICRAPAIRYKSTSCAFVGRILNL